MKLLNVMLLLAAVSCGSQAIQGPPGPQGSVGAAGAPGSDGISGSQGNAGTPGLNGAKGAQGNKGAPGPTGPKGDAGPSGADGNDGQSLAVAIGDATADQCANGGKTIQITQAQDDNTQSIVVCNGVDGNTGTEGAIGPEGSVGPQGNPGSNGHSIVMTTVDANMDTCLNGGQILLLATDINDNGVLDSNDANFQSLTICNGLNGQDGNNGIDGNTGPAGPSGAPSAFTPVGIVDPCGTAPGIYNEVFLRLANGMLLASFSDNASGENTRFSVLTPGTYETTDGDACVFTIDANYNIVNQNHQD
jgi:hypothetical protein